jgi:hypothetical protein
VKDASGVLSEESTGVQREPEPDDLDGVIGGERRRSSNEAKGEEHDRR